MPVGAWLWPEPRGGGISEVRLLLALASSFNAANSTFNLHIKVDFLCVKVDINTTAAGFPFVLICFTCFYILTLSKPL